MPSIEKLTIDTPEQVALEYPLAGIGSRFLAVFYDMLIQVIIYVAVTILAALAIPASQKAWIGVDKWATAAMIIVLFCLYWGYYAFFEAIMKGQTPGKRHAQIRVIKDNGRPITPFEAVARNLVRVIDIIPGFYAVGVITMLLNKRSRRLGDFVAGTVVVHERRREEMPMAWSAPAAAAAPVSIDAGSLGLPELELIETFLARRLDLAPELRRSTAEKLAGLLGNRLNLPPAARGADEDFLETLAARIRDAQRYRQL